jgi:hypothetical protein
MGKCYHKLSDFNNRSMLSSFYLKVQCMCVRRTVFRANDVLGQIYLPRMLFTCLEHPVLAHSLSTGNLDL